MEVRETALPDDSILAEFVRPGDFVDCYASSSDLDAESVAQRAVRFPRWVAFLMALRNFLVMPLGLRIGLPKGERIGFFPVAARGRDEILLGFDDRHLDFRLAILCRNKVAYAATWVRPHNWTGRIYLRLVLPFHRLIMRDAMKRVAETTPRVPTP